MGHYKRLQGIQWLMITTGIGLIGLSCVQFAGCVPVGGSPAAGPVRDHMARAHSVTHQGQGVGIQTSPTYQDGDPWPFRLTVIGAIGLAGGVLWWTRRRIRNRLKSTAGPPTGLPLGD